MIEHITPEYVFVEFFKSQLAQGKMGLIPSFSGFNEVLRTKMGIDPVQFTNGLAEQGLIRVSGKQSQKGSPYVVITLTDKGYTHFNLTKPNRDKVVVNKTIDKHWENLTEGKPVVLVRKSKATITK